MHKNLGDRITDWIDINLGTWRVILWEIGLILGWMIYNLLPFTPHLDAAPFFLLNLTMSMFATLTSNIIKMATDRHQSKLTEHVETTAKEHSEMLHNIQDELALLKEMLHNIKASETPPASEKNTSRRRVPKDDKAA